MAQIEAVRGVARIDADGRVIDLRRDGGSAGATPAADGTRRKSGANRKGD